MPATWISLETETGRSCHFRSAPTSGIARTPANHVYCLIAEDRVLPSAFVGAVTFATSPPLLQFLIAGVVFLVLPAALFTWLNYVNRAAHPDVKYGFGGLLLLFVFYYYWEISVDGISFLAYLAKNSRNLRSQYRIGFFLETLSIVSFLIVKLCLSVPLFRRAAYFPKVCICLYIITLCYPAINFVVILLSDYIANGTFTMQSVKQDFQIVSDLLYANVRSTKLLGMIVFPILSIMYMALSRRVHNTFVNGEPALFI